MRLVMVAKLRTMMISKQILYCAMSNVHLH